MGKHQESSALHDVDALNAKRSFLKGVVSLAAAGLAPAAFAANPAWPEKTVKIIVPFAAGGSTDLIGRMLAEGLGKQFPASNFVVENITGGATVPSILSVIRGGTNGHQIVLAAETGLFTNKYAFKKPPYDPDKDLKGATLLYRTPHWLTVSATSKFKSFQEFKDFIKANPGKISIGVNLMGGAAHMALELWKKENNFDFQVTPYKAGGNQAIMDIIGGHLDAHVDVLGNSYPFVKDGKLRPLAILKNTKYPEFPDAVPQDDSVATDLIVPSLLILTVHGKTPDSSVETIYQAVKKVSESPDFKEKMETLKFEMVVATPAETQKVMAAETLRFKKMFEMSGLELK